MLARVARSESDENILILGRGPEVRGRVIVDEDADDDTDVETRTDMAGQTVDRLGETTQTRRMTRSLLVLSCPLYN